MSHIRTITLWTIMIVFCTGAFGKDCPVTGLKRTGAPPDAQAQDLNRKKNRSAEPTVSQIDKKVTISKMLNSEDDSTLFDQSKGATITGYLVKAKAEGPESCNCYAADDPHHDIHIFIAPTPGTTDIGSCVVVEITPWVKTQHPEWTVAYLNSIAGHQVTLIGWLTFDWEHLNMSAAHGSTNPKRGTVWELHPITGIQDMDAEDDPSSAVSAEATYGPIPPHSNPGGGKPASQNSDAPTANENSNGSGNLLTTIILGALLGMAGQGIRIIIGMKKLKDNSTSKEHFDDQFDTKKLMFSIVYGILVGIIAGVLMAVQDLGTKNWDKSTIMAIIGAGYAGVDFIEGALSKFLPATDRTGTTTPPPPPPQAPAKTPITAVTGNPVQGGIKQ